MPAVFHRLKAAPFNLVKEYRPSDKPFDIADLAFHHATSTGLARAEQLCQPGIGGQVGRYLCHDPVWRQTG